MCARRIQVTAVAQDLQVRNLRCVKRTAVIENARISVRGHYDDDRTRTSISAACRTFRSARDAEDHTTSIITYYRRQGESGLKLG
jgi:hypothetical protein